jgi:hypothetical protein
MLSLFISLFIFESNGCIYKKLKVHEETLHGLFYKNILCLEISKEVRLVFT